MNEAPFATEIPNWPGIWRRDIQLKGEAVTIRQRSKWKPTFFALAVTVVIALEMFALSAPLLAQDDAQGEDNAELEALEERAAILEQELTILQTENQLIEARFGAAATPLDGTIETEGDAPIESQVLAYEAVNDIARRIAGAITSDVDGKPIVIYDAAQVTAVQNYVAFVERLKLLEAEYDGALSDEAGFVDVPAAISGIASTLAGTLALFRTDVKVTSKTLSIEDIALIAAVASHVTSAVYHPALIPPGFATPPVPPSFHPDAPDPPGTSELLKRLHTLDTRRQEADEEIKRLGAQIGRIQKQVTALDKEIAELVKKIKAGKGDVAALKRLLEQKQKEKAEAGRQLAELNTAKKELETVNAIYQAIRNGLIAGGNNTTAMLGLLNAERVCALLDQGAPILHLKIAAASGTTQTSNNLFAGSRLRHSGGAVATYVLFETGGAIKKSGNVSHRGEPRQFKHWNG